MWIYFLGLFTGFLVNIASAYAMPHIDKFLGKFSDYQRVKNEKRKAEIDFEINWMLDDHQYFLLKLSDKSSNSITLYIFLAIYLLFTLTPAVFPGIESLVTLLKELLGYTEVQSFYLGFTRESISAFTLIACLLVWLFLTAGSAFAIFIQIRRCQVDEIIIREYFKRKLKLLSS